MDEEDETNYTLNETDSKRRVCMVLPVAEQVATVGPWLANLFSLPQSVSTLYDGHVHAYLENTPTYM